MRLPLETIADILKLRTEGRLNLANIAPRVGTSRTGVQRICEKHGLGNIGLRNKTKIRKPLPRKITNKKLPTMIAAMRLVRRQYMLGAIKRGHRFELTEEVFWNLLVNPCFYCGKLPTARIGANRQRDGIDPPFGGIDRKDSRVGYTTDNCVPACKDCNFAKGRLSKDEFLELVVKIYQHRIIGGSNERTNLSPTDSKISAT